MKRSPIRRTRFPVRIKSSDIVNKTIRRTRFKRKRAKRSGGMGIAYGPLERKFSQWIRRRDKDTCQVCGQHGKRIEAAHIFGRGRKSVKYDPENCYAMCGGPSSTTCHHYFDQHQTEKEAWCRERIGAERFELLRLRSVRTLATPERNLMLSQVKAWLEQELAA